MKNLLKTTFASMAIALGGCHAPTTKTSAVVYHIIAPETHQVHKASIFDALSEKITFTSQENILATEFHIYSSIIGKYEAIHRQAQKYLCQPAKIEHCGAPLLGEAIELDRRCHETESQLIKGLRSEEDNKNFQGIELEKTGLKIFSQRSKVYTKYISNSRKCPSMDPEKEIWLEYSHTGNSMLFSLK